MLDPTGIAIGESVARGICAGIFLWAGVSKLPDPGFAGAIRRLTGLGQRPAAVAARSVPAAELAVGAGLLVPPLVQVVSIAAEGLLSVFTVVLISALLRGAEEPCGCFGAQDSAPVSWLDVGRNLALATAIFAAAWPATWLGIQASGGAPIEATVVAIGAAGIAVSGFAAWGNLRGIARAQSRVGTR